MNKYIVKLTYQHGEVRYLQGVSSIGVALCTKNKSEATVYDDDHCVMTFFPVGQCGLIKAECVEVEE